MDSNNDDDSVLKRTNENPLITREKVSLCGHALNQFDVCDELEGFCYNLLECRLSKIHMCKGVADYQWAL